MKNKTASHDYDSILSDARKILLEAGWTMVGHFSGEYWSNGDGRICLMKDEVRVISHIPCIMSLDSFVSTKGKGVVD